MISRSKIRAAFEHENSEEPVVIEPVDGFTNSDQLVSDINSRSDEIQRLNDCASGLEDILVSIEGLDSLSASHLLLVESGINLAFAGSPHRAPDLSPAMEARNSVAITMEKLSDTIAALIRRIRDFLRELWSKIREFFESIALDIVTLRAMIGYYRIKCNGVEGLDPTTKTVLLGRFGVGVVVHNHPPKNTLELNRSLEQLKKQLDGVQTKYLPVVTKIGESLTNLIPRWTGEEGSGAMWLDSLNKAAAAYDIANLSNIVEKTFEVNDSRFVPGSARVAAPLPGSRSMAFVDGRKIYDANEASDSTRREAAAIQASGISLIRMALSGNVDTSSAEMPVMSIIELRDIIKLVADIVDTLDAGLKSRYVSNLQRTARTLDSSLSKLTGSAESEGPYLRRGVAYADTYQRWVKDPYVQLLSHSLFVCRSTLSICARHISVYK